LQPIIQKLGQTDTDLNAQNEMRKLILILPMILVLVFSCNSSDDTPDIGLPEWLRESIEQDEAYVIQNPKKMPAWGVWERNKYKNEIYFEYTNMLSSLAYYPVISYHQDTLSWDDHSDYLMKKCCSKVVWHGSQIDDEYLELFHGN
jgi:hypothetical protein